MRGSMPSAQSVPAARVALRESLESVACAASGCVAAASPPRPAPARAHGYDRELRRCSHELLRGGQRGVVAAEPVVQHARVLGRSVSHRPSPRARASSSIASMSASASDSLPRSRRAAIAASASGAAGGGDDRVGLVDQPDRPTMNSPTEQVHDGAHAQRERQHGERARRLAPADEVRGRELDQPRRPQMSCATRQANPSQLTASPPATGVGDGTPAARACRIGAPTA